MPRRSPILLAAVAAAGLLAGCSPKETWTHRFGAGNALAGTLRDVAVGEMITEAELVTRLAGSRFVLVGAAPANADHARLAARLVGELAGEGERLAAVALESVPTDAQPLITEHMADHPRDAAGLGRVIQEAAPERPHLLARHAPVVEAALAAGAQVVAPDLSTVTLRGVLVQGFQALQPAFVRRAGLAEALPGPLARDLREELAAASCERADGRGLDALTRARRARDASMADRLAAITGRGQSVLVAAPAHVREDRGVPRYLLRLRPGADVATLAFVELPAADAAPPASLPYDYVWFTPAARPPGHDACGERREAGDRAVVAATSVPSWAAPTTGLPNPARGRHDPAAPDGRAATVVPPE